MSKIHKIATLLTAFESSAWMLEGGFYQRMAEVLLRKDAGAFLTSEEVDEIVRPKAVDGKAKTPARPFDYQTIGPVAVVPIFGVISKYSTLVERISAGRGCSCETIRNNLRLALADESVETIIIRVDSPGGSVAGIDDLAREIFQARDKKKIIALAEDTCASAAYYLASQAEKVFANSSAVVGSIGVIAGILDSHRAYENEGFHVVTIKSSDNKGSGTQGTVITEQQQRQWKTTIMGHYDLFIDAVTRGRKQLTREGLVAASEGAEHIADGRVYLGAEALKLGLIDGLATFEELVENNSPDGGMYNGDFENTDTETDGMNAVENDTTAKGISNMAEKDKNKQAEQKPDATKAVSDERQRCATVSKVLAGEPDLLEKALADGACDETAAKAMLADTLQTKLAEAQKANTELTAENEMLKGMVKKPAASGDDLPTAESTDTDGPQNWEAALAEFDAMYPKDPEKAQDEAMAAHPTLYAAWRQEQGIDTKK